MGIGTKQLAGEQDLLLGQGTVEQNRGGQNYDIKKINAGSIPYTGEPGDSGYQSTKDIIEIILGSTNLNAVVEW